MRSGRLAKALVCSISTAFLFTLPLLLRGKPFYLYIAVMIMLNVIFALGVRLVVLMGLPTLGHAGFGLIGAYVSALAVMRLRLSFWLALPLAGFAAAVIGVVTCYPAIMRLRGAYFLLVTFAINQLLVSLVSYAPWARITGGYEGIMGIPAPNALTGLLSIDFNSKFAYFYLTLVILIFMVLLTYRIDSSPFRRLINATNESATLAESIGINVARVRIITFAIACFSGGIAGSLFAHYSHSISPGDFGIWQSIYMLIYAVFGGLGSVLGPVLGATVLTIVPEMLRFTPMLQIIVFGILLIVVAVFFPHGLLGLCQEIPSLGKRVMLLTKGANCRGDT